MDTASPIASTDYDQPLASPLVIDLCFLWDSILRIVGIIFHLDRCSTVEGGKREVIFIGAIKVIIYLYTIVFPGVDMVL